MNVQTINPFADVQAETATGRNGAERVDAAGAFAALLASVVTGISTGAEGEVVDVPVTATEGVEMEEGTGSVESEEDAESESWLPGGMVAVQAPLLVANVSTAAAPVDVTTVATEAEMAVLAAEDATASAAKSPAGEATELVVTTSQESEGVTEGKVVLPVSSEPAPPSVAPVTERAAEVQSEATAKQNAQAAAATAAAATAATRVASEPENTVVPTAAAPTTPQGAVETLLAKAAVVSTADASKNAEALPVDPVSKKAQLRELAAKSAAQASAAEAEANSEGSETAPVLRLPEVDAGEPPVSARVVPALLEAQGEEAERGEEAGSRSISGTQGTESAGRHGVTVNREFTLAPSSSAMAAPAPVEVPVAELPKLTESSIKQILDSGEQRMTIRIKPDTLGEMQIEITRSGSDVQVRLTAATQSVRELLDAHAPQLREALAREGFDATRIQVSPPSSSSGLNLGHAGAGQQGQNTPQQQAGGQPGWSGQRFPQAAAANTATGGARAVPAGGGALNITV